MSTAVQTSNNVATNSPIIDIIRNLDGTIRVYGTAEVFTSDNLRHIVNRRMRWSTTEGFVRNALVRLTDEVNVKATGNTSLRFSINRVVNLVRDAANRRRAWVTVNDSIEGAVRDLIDAARRCV